MREKIVTTINNIEAPISSCKKFEAGYYLIGDPNVENSGDCYLVNGSYYRIETGKIVYDLRKGTHVLKSANITEGIVGFEGDDYKLGSFSLIGDEPIVSTKNGMSYYVIDETLVSEHPGYKERLLDGNYYSITSLPAKEFNKIVVPRREYKEGLPYDSKGITDEYLAKYAKLDIPIHKNVKNYSGVLKGLSFGLEFETSKGYIPERILDKTGLIPLRDGSIPGIEYVTVPMEGAKGMQNIINICDELNKRTAYDNSCSLHLHIGNIPRTKEFITAFFKLTLAFQDKIFEMFPLYKKYNFGVKRKNYTKPYNQYKFLSQMDPVINSNNIDKNFDVLFSYLAEQSCFADYGNNLDNVHDHPLNPNGNQKWNMHNRYYFVNFIPLIFGNKQTIEFRIHTPTYDVSKIMGFLLFNASLVNFTLKYQDKILGDPIFFTRRVSSLDYLLQEYVTNQCSFDNRGTMVDFLKYYVRYRTNYTFEQSSAGDIVGKEHDVHISDSIRWERYKVSEFMTEDDVEQQYYRLSHDNLANNMAPNGDYTQLGRDTKKLLDQRRREYLKKIGEGAKLKELIWE